MADLSSFSNQNFHASTWINRVLDDIPADESLDNYITSITLKLHMAAQDYSEQLETAMVESMSSMPRLVGDITRLEDQLRSVQIEMSNTAQNVRSVDKKGLTGIEDLSRLDMLKMNMERCKSTLEEHARWNQIVKEAKQLLESGGILSNTADRISSMFQSLDILKNLPGHEERLDTCNRFQSTLLDALRPNITNELKSMNIPTLQEYLYVFKRLNRGEEFEKIYLNHRPSHIRDLWSGSVVGKERLSERIALYLGNVARFAMEEENNIQELFGNQPSTTAATATATASSETKAAANEEKTTTVYEDQQVKKLTVQLLVSALQPIMSEQLYEELKRLYDPLLAYECYLVIEEFSRRTLATMEMHSASMKLEVLQAIFSGSWQYARQGCYLELEEKTMRRQLYTIMDRVALLPSSSTGARGGAGSAMEEEMIEPIEILTQFIERFTIEITSFLEQCLEIGQRAIRCFGGIDIKAIYRCLANLLTTAQKLLTMKIGNFAIALGYKDFIATSNIAAATGGGGEPYSCYLEENNYAAKLSERIFSSEISKQGMIAAALSALNILALFMQSLRSSYEGWMRESFLKLQGSYSNKSLQQLYHELDSSSNNSSNNNNSNRLENVGAIYAYYQLLSSNSNNSNNNSNYNLANELTSFLSSTSFSNNSSSSSSSSALMMTSNLLQFQGIFSPVYTGFQRLLFKTREMILHISIFFPVKTLVHYATDDGWMKELSYGHDEELDQEARLQEMKANLLPLSTVTQVGEHVLSFVQELEAYISTMPTVSILRYEREEMMLLASASSGWKRLQEILEINDDKSLQQLSSRIHVRNVILVAEKEYGQRAKLLQVDVYRKVSSSIELADGFEDGTSNSATVDAGSASATGGEQQQQQQVDVGFVNEWLYLVADAITGILLSRLLEVKSVGKLGHAQLFTDIDYFWNVINATGIKPHPILTHLKILVSQDLKKIHLILEDMMKGKPVAGLKDLIKMDYIIVNTYQ